MDMDAVIDGLDWAGIAAQLDAEGYALLPQWLMPEQARALGRHAAALERASLARGGLGQGDLHYFPADLPAPLAAWRADLYRRLAPISNRWSERLGSGYRYPGELEPFLRRGRQAGQTHALTHLSQLRGDDYVALHQRNEGAHVFALQLVALLAEPGLDFTGGEFVMTEQRPRMQSRPIVLPLRLGDAALIATAHRPVRGASGADYRVNLKHAISRVLGGTRIGLELSFHDAP
ncbi:prolyl 4-hydroxylase [Achromobacter sp. RTa]|uniref:2OG-Fe(II) oxygenase n=1 Tax=Achromobacter sp. RTa TaxID=1532557 RepID=UPI00051071B8|nr:2OG-Fe(II) oxygenase [Achromobacter sp. RTa]KGD89207.1 prolyl 4-hydroxylase [Achromobacter sp. RTa]